MIDFSRRKKVILFFALLVIGGYLVVVLARSSDVSVPNEFSEARMNGALIARDIVDLSSQSVDDLKLINSLDKKGDFTAAIDVITQTVHTGWQIREKAIDLSRSLENMTNSLSGIKSTEARQLAFESISNRLALISRLVNYSTYLGQLLEVLRHRFTGDFSDGDQVPVIISKINEEIQAINEMNVAADKAIKKFDELIK